MRKINKVIIHCSASPNDRDIGLIEINEWHRARGFKQSAETGFYVGYHAVIRLDGTVEIARPDSEPGVHCRGDNHDSLGICLVGDNVFNSLQIDSLMNKICGWLSLYALEPKQVFGHCEMPSGKTQGKSCPNLGDMDKFRDKLEMYYSKQGD